MLLHFKQKLSKGAFRNAHQYFLLLVYINRLLTFAKPAYLSAVQGVTIFINVDIRGAIIIIDFGRIFSFVRFFTQDFDLFLLASSFAAAEYLRNAA